MASYPAGRDPTVYLPGIRFAGLYHQNRYIWIFGELARSAFVDIELCIFHIPDQQSRSQQCRLDASAGDLMKSITLTSADDVIVFSDFLFIFGSRK
jgi:hypothetical protein